MVFNMLEFSTVVAALSRPYRHEGVGFQPNGGMGDREPRVQHLQRRATLVRGDAHTQGVELDKALRIRLIVGAGIVFEGGYTLVEQAVS